MPISTSDYYDPRAPIFNKGIFDQMVEARSQLSTRRDVIPALDYYTRQTVLEIARQRHDLDGYVTPNFTHDDSRLADLKAEAQWKALRFLRQEFTRSGDFNTKLVIPLIGDILSRVEGLEDPFLEPLKNGNENYVTLRALHLLCHMGKKAGDYVDEVLPYLKSHDENIFVNALATALLATPKAKESLVIEALLERQEYYKNSPLIWGITVTLWALTQDKLKILNFFEDAFPKLEPIKGNDPQAKNLQHEQALICHFIRAILNTPEFFKSLSTEELLKLHQKMSGLYETRKTKSEDHVTKEIKQAGQKLVAHLAQTEKKFKTPFSSPASNALWVTPQEVETLKIKLTKSLWYFPQTRRINFLSEVSQMGKKGLDFLPEVLGLLHPHTREPLVIKIFATLEQLSPFMEDSHIALMVPVWMKITDFFYDKYNSRKLPKKRIEVLSYLMDQFSNFFNKHPKRGDLVARAMEAAHTSSKHDYLSVDEQANARENFLRELMGIAPFLSDDILWKVRVLAKKEEEKFLTNRNEVVGLPHCVLLKARPKKYLWEALKILKHLMDPRYAKNNNHLLETALDTVVWNTAPDDLKALDPALVKDALFQIRKSVFKDEHDRYEDQEFLRKKIAFLSHVDDPTLAGLGYSYFIDKLLASGKDHRKTKRLMRYEPDRSLLLGAQILRDMGDAWKDVLGAFLPTLVQVMESPDLISNKDIVQPQKAKMNNLPVEKARLLAASMIVYLSSDQLPPETLTDSDDQINDQSLTFNASGSDGPDDGLTDEEEVRPIIPALAPGLPGFGSAAMEGFLLTR